MACSFPSCLTVRVHFGISSLVAFAAYFIALEENLPPADMRTKIQALAVPDTERSWCRNRQQLSRTEYLLCSLSMNYRVVY
ncbi:hypothetical protein JOM56_009079 [Amanita muscaria]